MTTVQTWNKTAQRLRTRTTSYRKNDLDFIPPEPVSREDIHVWSKVTEIAF